LVTREAEALLADQSALNTDVAPHVRAAVMACNAGVARAHLLNRHVDGAILLELFTRDGIGTLVSSTPFESLRQAVIGDVGGILDLIRPLETRGVLVKRSREHLEMDIEAYSVVERDGLIVGCAALHPFTAERMGELACLALHDDYRGEKRGERLLAHIEAKALATGLDTLFVLTTQATHWFREHGFDPAAIGDLPMARQSIYNWQRNSKVLSKKLDNN
jgi:amino-acid N-acetyltransferase